MPGVAEMDSAHAEWAAEIRAIANGPGSPIDKLHRINESLDQAGIPTHKEPGNQVDEPKPNKSPKSIPKWERSQ